MAMGPGGGDDDGGGGGDDDGGGDNDAEYQLFILLTPIGFHIAQAESAGVRLKNDNIHNNADK